ncbi:MAG: creatininase family protein, partial [Anaerolineae bacterium]
MKPKVEWERMFPDELEAAFSACPLLYYTYGLCEPHGPQNAIGLDALKAHAIACLAAQEHGGIVAPVDFWHIHELGGYATWAEKSIGQVPHSWLTAVPPWMHFKNVLYQIRQADALGIHGVILLTGHYGPNWEDLNTLVALVQPYVGARLHSLPDFEANTPGFAGDRHSGGDHAGRVETSLLWALLPELVDIGRVPEDVKSHPYAMGADVLESDRRIGERMVADEVRYLGERAKELLAAYQA